MVWMDGYSVDWYGMVSYSTHVDLTTDSGEMVHLALRVWDRTDNQLGTGNIKETSVV